MDVICVDDELMALKLLLLNCRKIDKIDSVQGFHTSAMAIEYARTHKFDVAICDIDMPFLDGFELSKELRKLNPNLRIIYTTAYSEHTLRALKSESSGYILKPVSVEKIRLQLSSLEK